MTCDVRDISSTESEAGIIATLIKHPDYWFMTDYLTPHHFVSEENGFLYYAISTLAAKNVERIDSYAIINILNAKESTRVWAEHFSHAALNEIIDLSDVMARDTLTDYQLLVDIVVNKAFRRDMVTKLSDCQRMCFNDNITDLQSQIYSNIDSLMLGYSIGSEVEAFSDKVDQMWDKVEQRQKNGGLIGLQSKIQAINNYWSYEPSELALICAARKDGKSIFCMNESMYALGMGKRVLYIDSEMSDEQQYIRMLSHLTRISVKDIKAGNYDPDGARRLSEANQWLKSLGNRYIHCYETQLNKDRIYLLVKRLINTTGLDLVVVDYIKSQGSNSSSEIYNMLGEYTDFLKNRIAGEFKIPVLAAAQLNRGGDIADSYKIEQFASVINLLKRKTEDEITRDGKACGNYKMFVKLNRLGEQMSDINAQYIDLQFSGTSLSFDQAIQQHESEEPF